MAIVNFSVSAGNPQVIAITNPTAPNNPAAVISVQNDSAGSITVEGRLAGNSNWAALGTVNANTLGAITFLFGLTDIRVSAAAAATGTVAY